MANMTMERAAVMNHGKTVEEWVALSGKQGEGQEGNIKIILSLTVSSYGKHSLTTLTSSFLLSLTNSHNVPVCEMKMSSSCRKCFPPWIRRLCTLF